MDIKKYRQIDILILTVIAIVCELIGYFAHIRFPGAGFYLSFSILLCMIAILRWGVWGCIVYPVAGLAMVFTAQSGQILEKALIYPVANCFIILSILLFKVIEKESIRQSAARAVIFVLVCYTSVAVGKGFALLLLGQNPLKGIYVYLAAELFNILIVTLAMLFLRKRAGLMSDMYIYFKEEKERLENEEKYEGDN